MAERTEVPAAVVLGKRKATETETRDLPSEKLQAINEKFARERDAAAAARSKPTAAVSQMCGSCRVEAFNYVQQCRRCANYICMGDACITPADPFVMKFPPGSGKWKYVCNFCAEIQAGCKRRQAEAASPETVAPKFKAPIVRNTGIAEPKLVESSEEEHDTEAEVPMQDVASREWLAETVAALVRTLLNVLYSEFFRKKLTK